MVQLQEYRIAAGIQTPKRSDSKVTSDMDWADEILEDAAPVPTGVGTRGLVAEVEAYFLDSQIRTDPVKFWQVSMEIFNVIHLMIHVLRRINSDIQQSSALPWIFFLSRRQQFLARGYSHQRRRQW
jgi:hypothetical protein